MKKIDVLELRSRTIKPLIYFKLKAHPEIDIIAVIVSDDDLSISISFPFLVMPIQEPGTQRLGLMIRPWSFILPKEEVIEIEKSDLMYYFELTDKSLINSYIEATTNLSIASPRVSPDVINLSEKLKKV